MQEVKGDNGEVLYINDRVTYEQIKEANKEIESTSIKRKDKKTGKVSSKQYAEVNQRIKVFRMLYPQGFIHTGIQSIENGVCIMRAEAGYFENGNKVILGTGTAYEKEGSTFINETSYIENCETSCIGRCLATLGIGIDTSIASKEEVENAKANQKIRSVPDMATLTAEVKTAKLTDKEISDTLEHYKVKDLSELTDSQKIEVSTRLVERIKELNESDS